MFFGDNDEDMQETERDPNQSLSNSPAPSISI